MAGVARINDDVLGTTAGEHSGHTKPTHPPLTFTGYIISSCSPDVYVNGRAVATVDSVTIEFDECCGSSNGRVAVGSPTVFVNNKPLARLNDALAPHSGSGNIVSASANVFCDE